MFRLRTNARAPPCISRLMPVALEFHRSLASSILYNSFHNSQLCPPRGELFLRARMRCRTLVSAQLLAFPELVPIRTFLSAESAAIPSISYFPFVYISFLMPPTQASPNPLYSS